MHLTRPAALVVAAFVLAACGGEEEGGAQVVQSSSPSAPATTASGSATAPAGLSGPETAPPVAVARTVAEGIETPWGVAFLPDGSALVAQRDSGRVSRVPAGGGSVAAAGEVPGVQHRGEGGLLGLAVPPASATGGTQFVYAYFTTGEDNRVVRMPWSQNRLGAPAVVLDGIPAGGNHNGGRIAIGPDGKLWIGTGEAGDEPLSQDRENLGGKILRVELDGSTPADNPFGTPVWSWGHRNVQGLAWDSTGQLWATEFGQNTYDELNKIVRGGNYGWPEVEGEGNGGGRFVEPFAVWSTDDNSPSGLAILDDVAYVAGLRGARLWQVPLAGSAHKPVARFTEEYGRLRTVVVAPDGQLWLTTSNTDGRGDPASNDDRILQLRVG